MKNIIAPTWKSAFVVIAVITMAWTISSLGYYEITDTLGLTNGYNEAPILMGAYYGVWAGMVIAVFRPDVNAWIRRASPGENRLAPAVMLITFALFALKVLPQLPAVDPPDDLNVADIVFAQPWYFLPKTVEILFQQVLLSALVLEMQAQKMSLRQSVILTAVLFGGFHLTLALTDANAFYVTRYTIAATLFGAIYPYLILQRRNGFVYAFSIHWAFYAFDTTMAHFAFAAASN
ncbi:hypothetical protein [Actibacterium lipolyticum]|uniref:CPBP family intramembrane metalloprotease n=1 Tax=Actibacterium lipolyticum TaxID=1524263 RepID=A0A238KI87_9RHOB|nr:hypothetical protein [Actibacterium lipolyticum]SMX42589.1 hypothetical protein COL8621_02020 [Actibacterium lipolyticum]